MKSIEETKLRTELETMQSTLDLVADLEFQIGELSQRLDKSLQTRNQLVTEIQNLSIELAARPALNESVASADSNTMLVECLRNERDSAKRKADFIKLEAKYQQE